RRLRRQARRVERQQVRRRPGQGPRRPPGRAAGDDEPRRQLIGWFDRLDPFARRADRRRRAAATRAVAQSAVAEDALSAPAAAGAAEGQFGTPGAPLNRRSPFLVGLIGGFGVLVAYGFVQSLARLSQVLTLLAVSLFLALG